MDDRRERVVALDPEARALIEATKAAGLPATHTLSPAEARRAANVRFALGAGTPEPVSAVREITVDGAAGPLAARVYAPARAAESNRPRPLLVYFHGGGWVLGSLDSHDPICRALANEVGAVVVSVDYRLAPEAKFPGPAEDCYAATVWAARNAAELGGDPSRLIVGGDSAGGNLAAAVALLARDRRGPAIAHQLLLYLVTDARFDTESYLAFAEDHNLTRVDMIWFWDQYLASPADAANPYASPLRAASLRDLPAALVVTAGFDPLRDEGEAYAEALAAAGVPVTLRRYPGTIHGFLRTGRALAAGLQAIAEIGEALRVS